MTQRLGLYARSLTAAAAADYEPIRLREAAARKDDDAH